MATASPPVSRGSSPLIHVETQTDEKKPDPIKLTPLEAAVPLSFSDKYTDFLGKKYLNILPTDPQDSTLKRGMKAIARMLVTYIALPYFALVGMLYNAALTLAKGAIGVVKLILPNKAECLKGYTAQNCFKESFKHLCFGIIDGLSWFFSPLITGAYGFAPEYIDELYDSIEDEVKKGEVYELVASVFQKLKISIQKNADTSTKEDPCIKKLGSQERVIFGQGHGHAHGHDLDLWVIPGP